MQLDYSDLYNIMSFFVGSPDGRPGRDDLAQQIAEQGKRFAEEHWRWEDMQAYVSVAGSGAGRFLANAMVDRPSVDSPFAHR